MLHTSTAPLRGYMFHASEEVPTPSETAPLLAPHDEIRCRHCGCPSTVPAGACHVCPNCGESTGCS